MARLFLSSHADLLALWLLFIQGTAALAQDRFCIVPVKDGAPTEADVGNTWRMVNNSFRIPGLPMPVFTPVNRQGEWTIDEERRFVRYRGPFPRAFWTAVNGLQSRGVTGS